MSASRLIIGRLAFTELKVPIAELSFSDGVNVIWGASNTGKSFTVKALDFMSGSKPKRLPKINERVGYDKTWLDLRFRSQETSLSRARSPAAASNYTTIGSSLVPRTKPSVRVLQITKPRTAYQHFCWPKST